jgi:hypothetical protein
LFLGEGKVNMKRLCVILIIISLILPVHACTGSEDEEKPTVFQTIPGIQKIRPEKPVKIKLRRNAKGEYSWEIKGNNSDKVLEENRNLEKNLRGK